MVSLSGNFGIKVILDAEQGESVKVTAVISRRDIFERNQIWLVTLPKSPLFAVAEQALRCEYYQPYAGLLSSCIGDPSKAVGNHVNVDHRSNRQVLIKPISD